MQDFKVEIKKKEELKMEKTMKMLITTLFWQGFKVLF